MAAKPIKRNENIQVLSREHHFGLLFCWKIRAALKRGVEPERIAKYVSFFWDNHLEQHFQEEEEHLFLKVKDDECLKALSQHEEIRSLIENINEPTDQLNPELLTRLADRVNEHIRFEERELFSHLENILSPAELIHIGAALEHTHAIPFQDNYPDEFWK